MKGLYYKEPQVLSGDIAFPDFYYMAMRYMLFQQGEVMKQLSYIREWGVKFVTALSSLEEGRL